MKCYKAGEMQDITLYKSCSSSLHGGVMNGKRLKWGHIEFKCIEKRQKLCKLMATKMA